MSSNINETVNDFNDMLLSLAINLSTVCPHSIIGTNISEIKKAIKNPDNFKKFIDTFCIKVLPYKKEIDSGDETFFMEKDYSEDLKESGTSALDHVISLKSIWNDLKKENKKIVIFNMQCLCALALDYYNHVISKINKS